MHVADPQLEPVDWAGVKTAASGPRHYEGSEANARPIWKCPACGEDNQGLLEDGCSSCQSGGGAKHVGVPPTVQKQAAAPPPQPGAYPTHPDLRGPTVAEMAYSFWLSMQSGSDDMRVRLAFLAGWKMAKSQLQDSVTLEIPNLDGQVAASNLTPTAAPLEELEGTIQSRTLIAALTFFADQVLKQQPEETVSGEWMTADQINSLIEDVKVKYV